MMDLDWDQLLTFGGFGVALLGLLGTAWWRITVMIKDARVEASEAAAAATREASIVRQELAAHRLHTAEQYLTKSGMREVTEQIMEAIGGIGVQIAEMRGRIDRVFEKPGSSRTAAHKL